MPVFPPPPAGLDSPQERPALLIGGLSRRRLLQATGAGGLVLIAGTWLYRAFWRLGAPAPGRQCLTVEELATAGAAAECFFPGPPRLPFSAADVKLAEFADEFVGGQYEDNQRLFKVLLRMVERWPTLSKGRGFSRLPLADRQAVLTEMKRSDWMVWRAAHESLRYMFSLGYFEDMRVRQAMGIKFGCDLSARFPAATSQDDGGGA